MTEQEEAEQQRREAAAWKRIPDIRKAINSCFGGMGPGSTIWGNTQWDKGFAAGVLAALTAFDTACENAMSAERSTE